MSKFHVPADWSTAKLAAIADIQTGLAKGKRVISSRISLPYLRVANVQDGHLDLCEVKTISVDEREVSRYLLRQGDVLFTEGGDFDKLGRGTVWRGEIQKCLHQNHVFAVRPNPKYLDSEYLAYLAASPYGRCYFQASSKRSTNLASINSTQLKNFPIIHPPITEQRQIVAILRTWDEAIRHLDSLVAAKENAYAAYSRRFFDQCHPCFGSRDQQLQPFLLGKLFKERDESGLDSDVLLSITMADGVIAQETVGRRDSSAKDKSKYKLILPGDIGYNTMRMWQGVCGLSAFRGVVSPAYTVVTPVEARINPRYAYHLFKSKRMINDFERYSQGLTSDTWNLKFPAFSEIKVFVPPVQIQIAQANFFDSLKSELDILNRQAGALSMQKRGLMQKLLTGEWRVKP